MVSCGVHAVFLCVVLFSVGVLSVEYNFCQNKNVVYSGGDLAAKFIATDPELACQCCKWCGNNAPEADTWQYIHASQMCYCKLSAQATRAYTTEDVTTGNYKYVSNVNTCPNGHVSVNVDTASTFFKGCADGCCAGTNEGCSG